MFQTKRFQDTCQCGVCTTRDGTISDCCPCDCDCQICINRTAGTLSCCPACDCPCEVCRFTWNGTVGCCPVCGCKCGVTINPEQRFWGRVTRPESSYCTPCCKCGLLQIPFVRERCKLCPPKLPTGCFPATSSVTLQNGKQILMSELQVGDPVQTGMF